MDIQVLRFYGYIGSMDIFDIWDVKINKIFENIKKKSKKLYKK